MGSKGGMQPMTNSGGTPTGGKFGNYPSPTQELNSRNPYSGYSPASASMPMAYGPTGTQNQNQNPYQYRLYGSDSALPGYDQMAQQPFQNYSNFGSVGPQTGKGFSGGQPFDREAAYNQLMQSPLGQKFGFAMDTYRGIMNPALGMQSYGVGPYAEGATDYQGMAQEASGVGQNATAPAPAPKREMPSFLVPYSQAGFGNTASRNQPLHGRVNPALAGFMNARAYNSQTGAAPNIIVDDKYRFTNKETGDLAGFVAPSGGMRAIDFYSGGATNRFGEEFLYDPGTNTLYSPDAARERFGY